MVWIFIILWKKLQIILNIFVVLIENKKVINIVKRKHLYFYILFDLKNVRID